MYGRYKRILHKENFVSQEWLRIEYLFIETEGFVAAIQDKIVATRTHWKVIMKKSMSNILSTDAPC